ncbi:hypothetical protein QOZ73_32775, partial [Pseudomonas aeruginosa]|uniref:hypothetical protein n=1 Tax=Pseudomonas aeruginosa TaxID=287 RepID=UPI003459D727
MTKEIEKIWEVGGKSLEWTEDNPIFESITKVMYKDGSRWTYKGFIADAVNELIKQSILGNYPTDTYNTLKSS